MGEAATKYRLGDALKQMMAIKPIDRITITDISNICEVNRQTFYYHFDDIYDLVDWVFETDTKRALPYEIIYEHWRDDVLVFFDYLYENRNFALNLYNNVNCRHYMLMHYRERLEVCINSFADIVSRDIPIERTDFRFVVEFYTDEIMGIITLWLENGMETPEIVTKDRFLQILDHSMEDMLNRFRIR